MMNSPLPLENFRYRLPEDLIAQDPLPDRARARLMVLERSTQNIRHETFDRLEKYLPPKSVLVLNNTRVIPARLLGTKPRSGGKVEIFVLKRTAEPMTYEVMMKPLKRIRCGDIVTFAGSRLRAKVISVFPALVKFNRRDLYGVLAREGHMPLPPYIRRRDNDADRENYQTVYARHRGSVAAPTAGLHFTRGLMKDLARSGFGIEYVTLHVNYATFKPVEEENILDHKMHTEEYSVSAGAWERLQQAKNDKRPIVAVGTTSCRVLESVAATGRLRGETNLFIYPGYEFKMMDHLITNFHLPCSTLLMLVSAFAGMEQTRRAYDKAIEEKYRFYSYGDAMLIL